MWASLQEHIELLGAAFAGTLLIIGWMGRKRLAAFEREIESLKERMGVVEADGARRHEEIMGALAGLELRLGNQVHAVELKLAENYVRKEDCSVLSEKERGTN